MSVAQPLLSPAQYLSCFGVGDRGQLFLGLLLILPGVGQVVPPACADDQGGAEQQHHDQPALVGATVVAFPGNFHADSCIH